MRVVATIEIDLGRDWEGATEAYVAGQIEDMCGASLDDIERVVSVDVSIMPPAQVEALALEFAP